MKLTWGEAWKIVKDRDEWRQIVKALFPKWEEEDKVNKYLFQMYRRGLFFKLLILLSTWEWTKMLALYKYVYVYF